MKHITLFEDFDNNQYGDVRFGKDVIAITDLLKKMTDNKGRYNFEIDQSSAQDIIWREYHEDPEWSITLYAFGRYAGVCYVSTNGKRTKINLESPKDTSTLLSFIKKQSKTIKSGDASKWNPDNIDIRNQIVSHSLAKHINVK